MHISKDMVREELQRYYFSSKVIAFFMSKPWAVRVVHKLEARMNGKNIDGMEGAEEFIPSRTGAHQIRVRIFRPENSSGELPGMLYIHGGGYMVGNPESYLDAIRHFVNERACVVVAPDYRKALDAPYPAALDDCYDTLLWMQENSEALGILPDKFIVGGHSAGGGLTAAVSLKTRDTQEVQIAFQMPIYPMIDDRQDTESARDCDAPAWNTAANRLGWYEYLKGIKEMGSSVHPYAAPARAVDYAGLPPTLTIVGDLEPFKDETIQYVENLKNAGVPVRFKLYPGCFHGFDLVAPEAEVSKESWAFVRAAYAEYYDMYFQTA